jgi:hypothetical protein
MDNGISGVKLDNFPPEKQAQKRAKKKEEPSFDNSSMPLNMSHSHDS